MFVPSNSQGIVKYSCDISVPGEVWVHVAMKELRASCLTFSQLVPAKLVNYQNYTCDCFLVPGLLVCS